MDEDGTTRIGLVDVGCINMINYSIVIDAKTMVANERRHANIVRAWGANVSRVMTLYGIRSRIAVNHSARWNKARREWARVADSMWMHSDAWELYVKQRHEEKVPPEEFLW
jgi:hypothetical protein